MTSFAVSRGRLESLVGKRFAAGGLRVYFAGILLLLLIISVTHSTCGVLCTVVGGVCATASTILAVAIAKFRS